MDINKLNNETNELNLDLIKQIVGYTDKDSMNYIQYDCDNNESPFGNIEIDIPLVSAKMLNTRFENKSDGKLSFDDIVKKIYSNTETVLELPITRSLPVDVTKLEHYQEICTVMDMIATQTLYNETKRYSWNYMIVSSNILPILAFSDKFKHVAPSTVYGGYLAGEYDGKPVYVSPSIPRNEILCGVNEFLTFFGVYHEKDNQYEFKVVNSDLAVIMKLND